MGKTQFDKFEIEELPSDLHHWRNAFDARFLRHTNLEGKPRVVTIENVQWLKSSNRNESKRQLLVTLREFEKPWAINVTNSEAIALLYNNDDPRSWVGKRVTLYPAKTKFGPQVVDCIRVRDQIPAEPLQSQQSAAGNIPNDQRQQTQQSDAGQRTMLSAACSGYLQRMKDATSLVQLAVIEEAITNDNTLNAEETGLLVKAHTRRDGQIRNPAP